MTPNKVELLSKESARMNSLGIPYKHIMIGDGKPIVIVPDEVMHVIISERDQGKHIPGLFVSEKGNKWTASKIEHGKHDYIVGMAECSAFRWLLGYQIGERQRRSRYVGQPDYRHSRKKRKRFQYRFYFYILLKERMHNAKGIGNCNRALHILITALSISYLI